MEAIEAITAIAVLSMAVTAILGVIGLINPRWFGISSRGKSSAFFFGIFFACLVVVEVLMPSKSDKVQVTTSSEKHQAGNTISASSDAKAEGQPTSIRYVELSPLLTEFSSRTKLQQEEWNNANQWKHWVEGRGVVSEVKKTNVFSEINEAVYEVLCEFDNKDRAILFYSKQQREYVMSLNKGDVIEFKGRLKKILDWGFWRSGYVKVN